MKCYSTNGGNFNFGVTYPSSLIGYLELELVTRLVKLFPR
jgi:hypothetical protein